MHCAASRWLYPSFSYICISTSKGVHQDMAAAHAGVNDLDVSDILVFALLLDFVELLAHFLGLRSFRQIISSPSDRRFLLHWKCAFLNLIPAHFLQATTVSINALFFPLVDEDAAKAVFDHIADDPVRVKSWVTAGISSLVILPFLAKAAFFGSVL